MGNIVYFKKALARRQEFYNSYPEAKAFVDELLNLGMHTMPAFEQMRLRFAKEYYDWKRGKGYPVTNIDREVLNLIS